MFSFVGAAIRISPISGGFPWMRVQPAYENKTRIARQKWQWHSKRGQCVMALHAVRNRGAEIKREESKKWRSRAAAALAALNRTPAGVIGENRWNETFLYLISMFLFCCCSCYIACWKTFFVKACPRPFFDGVLFIIVRDCTRSEAFLFSYRWLFIVSS